MSLRDLSEKITDLRDKAASELAGSRQVMNSIRANSGLSTSGKAAELAKNYLAASKTTRELERQERELLTSKRSELERRLFGQFSNDPSAIIAYRDAQDRASRLAIDDADKAAALLRTAELSGDVTLSAAIVGRAMECGWEPILQAYAANHPAQAAELNDLADIVHFQEDPAKQFDAFNSYKVTKPSEIERRSDRQLEEIAKGEHVRADVYGNGQRWA
jgi:hypothetical protein